MTAFTPRQLRVIADQVERLTKARRVNEQSGVAATPDVMALELPGSVLGILRWTQITMPEHISQRRLRLYGSSEAWRYELHLSIQSPTRASTGPVSEPTPPTPGGCLPSPHRG